MSAEHVNVFPIDTVSCETPDEELRRCCCMLCDERLDHVKRDGCTEPKCRRVCRWPKQLRSHPTASSRQRTPNASRGTP